MHTFGRRQSRIKNLIFYVTGIDIFYFELYFIIEGTKSTQ